MRTHAQIIKDGGNPAKFGAALGLPAEDVGRVHQWKRSDSIPGEYWKRIAAAGLATADELAAWAERRAIDAGKLQAEATA